MAPQRKRKPGPLPRVEQQRQRDRKGLVAGLCVVAALLTLTGGYLWLLGGATPSSGTAIGGPFELTAGNGQTVTDRSFGSQYLLVYFGYSSCRDVCPTTLSAVGDAMDALGPRAARIQPLFITVDPRRDTPEVLSRYVAAFTPRLVGLTGTPRQIRQVQQEYRVSSVVHTSDTGVADYTVDHSSVLYLIGPDGRYLAPIPADATGRDMAADIAKHLL